MFTTKAEADAHDKKLELAEALSEFIGTRFTGKLDESVIEDLSMLIADNKDVLAKALKGKPSVLLEEAEEPQAAVKPVKSVKAA